MSSITEDDVEDSTVDGDEDDEKTVISSKHPKIKTPFLISTHVPHAPSRSNSPSKSPSQSKSQTNLVLDKNIEQKDFANSVMVWKDEDENVCSCSQCTASFLLGRLKINPSVGC